MGLKPAALIAVNGKYRLDGARASAAGRLICSSLGCQQARVHPACNTRFEFDLNACRHLDKTPIPQHAAEVLHHSRQQIRVRQVLDWGWS
jgi:hypothetical protein